MEHPMHKIPTEKRRNYFLGLSIATISMMIIFNAIGIPLQTPSAPYGIISYELAGSLTRVEEVLASWDHQARLRAAFGLGLDYLFMLIYASAISLACIWAVQVMRARGLPFGEAGEILAWGQWLAALLDACENVALTIMLWGNEVSPLPQIAQGCAILKFGLIFMGLTYAFLGLALRLVVISR